jgi:hypothetical protein
VTPGAALRAGWLASFARLSCEAGSSAKGDSGP